MLTRVWSHYQERIFQFVSHDLRNGLVEAVAGSGKSTTLEECSRRAGVSYLLLAFNRHIAKELKSRGLNARTFHSLTFMPVLKDRRVPDVDDNKLRKLVNQNLAGAVADMYGAFIINLVGLGRQSGIGCLNPDTIEAWEEIVAHHDLALEKKEATMEVAIELASNLLGWSNKAKMVDFEDLLYFAVRDGITLPSFDFVMVDEAQDTNAIQRAVLRKVLTPKARLLAVGDPAQAIYGFRGADSQSLNLIGEEFQCVRLPLSVTYRCPTTVVQHARQWVNHIEAAPGAAAGSVEHLGTKWELSQFVPGELVVCRNTRPVVSLAYQLIKRGKPARVVGRQIGDGLTSLVKRMGAESIDELEVCLTEYRDRETEKAIAKGDESKAEAIEDKVATVMVLVRELPENERTIAKLIATIDGLFKDKSGPAVTLSTIHRAKGLEADTVYWLNSEACPPSWVKKDWQKQQEVNLCYVATTRAKQRLVLIQE